MKAFATLVAAIGSSTKTNDKLEALQDYFTTAADSDKVWVIAIFSGRRPKRIVNTAFLKNTCMELTGLPPWLFDECYHTVGDLGETIALLLPEPVETTSEKRSLTGYMDIFLQIQPESDEVKKAFITTTWQQLNFDERFVFNKLITGGFRIGVSQTIMVKALAKTQDLPASQVAHCISGAWDPATTLFEDLLGDTGSQNDHSKPYPFYLAYAVEGEPADLGAHNNWTAEWKWDGIRGQIIKRNEELFVWSRGEELMTDKFPEYQGFAASLPNGTVLDGEIICLNVDATSAGNIRPLPFAALQTRIGRKTITKKQLTEAPVGFIAYDLLEYEGKDIREMPLQQRKQLLATIVQNIAHPLLLLSPVLEPTAWNDLHNSRALSREIGSEGLMLKRNDSAYRSGRKKGDWWKWKVDPLTIDAVMIYAQKGHGRRSNLYTDYTFAVKDGDQLVPFAKAYSGLTDKEFAQVDAFVKRNSIEKFGPVRTVQPTLVFELAFEGIAASNRHKSGVALRFPRMSRWRKDKTVADINTLEDLKLMLQQYNNRSILTFK